MPKKIEPCKYAKDLSLKISEEEHRNLKMLAGKERRTIKGLLFTALDIAFPEWNKEK